MCLFFSQKAEIFAFARPLLLPFPLRRRFRISFFLSFIRSRAAAVEV